MGQSIQFNTSAQLFENESGDLAIRFSNNMVFTSVGANPGKGFVTEALELLNRNVRPKEWRMIPYRMFFNEGQHWRLVGSLGFLDGDEKKPALGLDVKPDEMGEYARGYLKHDIPNTLL